MEPLGSLVWLQGGALAVLTMFSAWCLHRVLTGKLVPESQHLRELAQRDAALEVERAEKGMWRETALTSSSQAQQMAEGQDTVIQLLRGLIDEKDTT